MRGLPLLTIFSVLALALIGVPSAAAQSGTGGTGFKTAKAKPRAASITPGSVATIGVDGRATAPADAPPQVHAAITAANRIIGKPYRYGGGHARVEDSGYDCSGTISYALIKAGLLSGTPLDSTGFMSWGEAGKGKWITVYAHGGHAYLVVAGLRLDTGNRDRYVTKWGGAAGSGPRWGRPRNPAGFTVRHPLGL